MIERRFLSGTEVRSTGANSIAGYAATWNSSAKLRDFRERLAPGAFTRAINERQDVAMLVNHNPEKLLGRTTSGTLRLKQDSRGLAFECDLPNTQEARDAHQLIKRGDLRGCSFAFVIGDGKQEWTEERDNDGSYFVQRTISDIAVLNDCSVVTFPAYSNTSVSARSSASVPVELRSAVDAHNAALSGGYFFSNCRTVEEAQAKADRFAARVNEHRAAKATATVTRRRNLLNSIL